MLFSDDGPLYSAEKTEYNACGCKWKFWHLYICKMWHTLAHAWART